MKRLKRVLKYALLVYVIYFLVAFIFVFKIPHYKKSDLSYDINEMYNESEEIIFANVIETNLEAMDYRLNIIKKASKSIKLMSYQYEVDYAGKVLMSALVDKADEGVKVELIVDGTLIKGRYFFRKINNHPNIDIYFYERRNVLLPYRNNNVLHDKIINVDDKFVIIGGRNTSNRFLLQTNITTDRDVLIYNENNELKELKKVSSYFDEVRDSKFTRKLAKRKERKLYEIIKAQYDDYMTNTYKYSFNDMVSDSIQIENATFLRSPINRFQKEPVVLKTLMEIASNYEDVLIQSPYITKSRLFKNEFKTNKSVTLLTNNPSSNPNSFALTSYFKIRKKLASEHNLYEIQTKYSHHAKTMIFGDDLSYIGTSNMDHRSTYLSLESGMVIYSKDFNEKLSSNIDELLADSLKVSNDGSYIEDSNVEEIAKRKFKEFILKGISHISFLFEELL